MSDTELAVVDLNNLDLGAELGVELVNEGVLAQTEEVMTSTSFLPRLQVNNAMSQLVTLGKSSPGVFVLVYSGDKFVELGKEVPFLAISVRPKAMLMPPEGGVVCYYDTKSPDFAKIAAKAQEKGMNGNMVGPEFLIWIPSQNTFATFYFSSKTMQNVAFSVVMLMRKNANDPAAGLKVAPVRGKMRLITNKAKKQSWWGAEFSQESTPLPPAPATFTEDLTEILEKFKNPPVTEVEAAPAAAQADGRVR